GGGSGWSAASVDERRGLLFFATGFCGEDANVRPYEEAIIALHLDGTPAWHWRPRQIDVGDLDFGAVPNLFTITVSGKRRDVVGEGGKDGTYYVIDREGTNVANGVRWDDPDPAGLPYWATHVVPGGAAGGIIATAAVDGLVILGGGAGQRSGDPTDSADAASKIPVKVTALCVAGTRGCDPRATDGCDAGGSAPQDAQDLAAVRVAMDGACPWGSSTAA